MRRKVIPLMTHPGIEMCGYTVRQAVTDGTVHAEAVMKLNERFPADATTAIMDLTVEAEAFGAQVVFEENSIPTVIGRLVSDYESVSALEIPTLDRGRVSEYLKADILIAKNITDKPVYAGCVGPFSLAGRLFDLSEMMMAMYIEPETVSLLLEKCTAFLVEYLKAIKATGVDGVFVAEPAAGLTSGEDCSAFSSKYVKRMVEAVQDESFTLILHNCGNTGHCTSAMVETGAGGLHFGNKVDMVDALESCPLDRLVMGNIDPVGIMKMSSPSELKNSVRELLVRTSGYPNFILSTGCDVPPGVPEENIRAFYEAVNEYNMMF